MYNYGARFYDPAIARFTTVDRFASDFPSWSPYHYANNNPISNIDFNGDSTRVYSTSGAYQMTINDDLANEDHFYSSKQLEMLCNTSSCGTVDEQGQFYRDNSSFFIGSKTRSELESIRSFSKGEEGFLLIPGKDRQLTVYNAHKFRSGSGSTHFEFNTRLITSMGQVGAGHTHEV